MLAGRARGIMVWTMLRLGYKASAEQFGPGDLLRFAVFAERHGFDSVWTSDHYQPWRHTDGHAPNALVWLGAAAVRTEVSVDSAITGSAGRFKAEFNRTIHSAAQC